MIINIEHKADLITLDLRCKQMRYCHDIEAHGLIEFLDLSRSDVEAYEYLHNNSPDGFLNCIVEDCKSFLNIDVDIESLKVRE